MSNNGFPRNPAVPVMLSLVDPWGQTMPGHGWDPATNQWVPLSYPAHGNVNPDLPWDFNNPLYQALYRGEVTIELQPRPMGAPTQHGHQLDHLKPQFKTHQDVALVPTSEYGKQNQDDTRPSTDMGTTSLAIGDKAADIARQEYVYPKPLVAYVVCLGGDNITSLSVQPQAGVITTTSPLDVAPVGSPPVGGAVANGEIRFGHKGTQLAAFFDTTPSNVQKIPFSGSTGLVVGHLFPKYYSSSLVGGKRVYLLNPGGVQLTNALWNNLPKNVMALNGFTNPNAAVFQGFIGQGYTSAPSQYAGPTRRFYGTVLTTGAVAGQDTIVPVAWNAVGVSVTGGLFTAATATFSPVQFLMNGPVGSAQVGPFNANDGVIHPLIENCQSIEIFNSAASLAGAEIPFEVTYYLSF